ncbi:MAG TPA: hypothetical protein VFS00_03525 [Polyangiaceae bacterium]|nr:hypothetical protein [Polyangiaceae bacterium]
MFNGSDLDLRIVWWNTSLRGAQVDAGHLEAAGDVLADLRRLALVDVFLLGETAQPHLNALQRRLNELRPGVPWRVRPSQQHDKVEIGVLFDASKVKVARLQLDVPVTNGHAGRQVVTRLLVEGAPELHLVIAHWPSRLHDPQQRMKRDRFGEVIRARYRSLARRSGPDAPPYFLVMGDFNDEPFDRSIAEEIGSTRDRELARRKPDELLYNTSWRHLGEAMPHPENASTPAGAGTYFYRRGAPTTRWYTFDQTLVSASFLGPSGWRLDEAATGPVRLPGLVASVTSRAAPFDHLPIVAALRHSMPATLRGCRA